MGSSVHSAAMSRTRRCRTGRDSADALREQVQRQRDQVDVAGPLAVAEQAPLDPLAAGHQRKLGGGDRGAAVVVGMQGDDHAVAPRHVAAEPLDHVGVEVRRRHLDGGRQVQHQAVGRGRLEHVLHRRAHLQRVVDLGAGVRLGRVLVPDRLAAARREGLRALPHPAGAAGRDLPDALAVVAEDDPALQLADRVVEVHDRARNALERDERPIDQVLPALHEDDDRDVVRDQLLVDERAHEVEVGLRGRREPDLDLLEPELDQQPEQATLAVDVHRVDQRLVPVAEIDGDPLRRSLEPAVGPGAVRQLDGRDTDGSGGRAWSWGRTAPRRSDGQAPGADDATGRLARRGPFHGRVSQHPPSGGGGAAQARAGGSSRWVASSASQPRCYHDAGGTGGAWTTRMSSRVVTRKLHE